jgi:hypothetical protein
LKSIWIPRSIERLGKGCFMSCQIETLVFETGSNLRYVDEGCFQMCSLRTICIPSRCQLFGKFAFSKMNMVERILFETGSQLARISESCFAGSSLGGIILSSSISVVGQNCFANCRKLREIGVLMPRDHML